MLTSVEGQFDLQMRAGWSWKAFLTPSPTIFLLKTFLFQTNFFILVLYSIFDAGYENSL